MFAMMDRRNAVTVFGPLELFLQFRGIVDALIPKGCMVILDVSDQFILPYEVLEAYKALFGEHLGNMRMSKEVNARAGFHCLHDETIGFEFLRWHVRSNLDGFVVILQVLSKSMLRGENLEAKITREGR